MVKEKDLSTVVEITQRVIPRELEDFQAQKRQRHEHSYNMTMDMPTVPEPIEREMKKVLETYFGGKSYDPDTIKQLVVEAADKIKNDTMGLVSERVKVVAQVVVVQNRGQSTRAISRCIWDPAKDRSISAIFENQELFAVATVFALFYE